jgi:hypothetical protein
MKIHPLTLALLAPLAAAAPAAAQTTYILTELAPPGAASLTQPFAINSFGDVALSTSDSGPIGDVWVMGPHGTRPLPPLPGEPAAYCRVLLNNGRAAGASGLDFPFLRPCAWSKQGVVRELRMRAGDTTGFAFGGNGSGWLVGFSSTRAQTYDQPALWIADVLVPLDLPAGFDYGSARCVNASGRIAGEAWDAGFTMTQGWVRDGLAPPVAIGAYPGHTDNRLVGINADGIAVGTSFDGAGVTYGLSVDQGQLSVYAPPAGMDSLFLTSINRAGQMAGFVANFAVGDPPMAAVVDAGSAVVLQDVLDPVSGAGWMLVSANDINNAGQIACIGFAPSGNIGACVLTPASPLTAGPSVNGAASHRPQLTPQQVELAKRVVEQSPAMWGAHSRVRGR